jgi:hypothetical protein
VAAVAGRDPRDRGTTTTIRRTGRATSSCAYSGSVLTNRQVLYQLSEARVASSSQHQRHAGGLTQNQPGAEQDITYLAYTAPESPEVPAMRSK